MRKKNGIVLAIGLLVVAAAGWWFASPWWTLKAMRDAAAAHDERALSAHVDYPALRADLTDELLKQVTTDGRGAAGFGAIGAVVAAAIAGPVVNATVTPEGVRAMFSAEEVRAKTVAGATVPERPGKSLPRIPSASDRPVIERDGLDQFRVHGREAGSATIVFRRYGLGWKLAGVDLPSSSPGV